MDEAFCSVDSFNNTVDSPGDASLSFRRLDELLNFKISGLRITLLPDISAHWQELMIVTEENAALETM